LPIAGRQRSYLVPAAYHAKTIAGGSNRVRPILSIIPVADWHRPCVPGEQAFEGVAQRLVVLSSKRLHVDAYAGYDGLFQDDGPWEVACWAHARRYFYEARTSDAARAESAALPPLEDPLAQWQQEDVVRLRLRQERSMPLLTAFREWLEREQPQVLPKSPLGQAIAYALTNWEALRRYTTAGCLAIDNNVSERTLRQCVLGRKNYLFVGSDRGGQTAAILYSFTATCRRHDVDPFTYLRDVLTRLPTHSPEQLVALLPERWAAARPPNTS